MEFEFKGRECKCGSKTFAILKKGTQKGLYCANCGRWIKWLSKDDINYIKLKLNSVFDLK